MDIQKEMKKLRMEKGWTQEDLAEKMFVSKNAISNYETGLRQMDAEKIEKMCAIFGLEISEVMKVASNPVEVSIKDIMNNGFNLSAKHYIDKQPVTVKFDISYGLEKEIIKRAAQAGISKEEMIIRELEQSFLKEKAVLKNSVVI